MKKIKTLNEYVSQAKLDIYAYIIITIVLFFILLLISYIVSWYFLLLIDVFLLFIILKKIEVYHNIKKIRNYLSENNLIDKIGKIDYWNDEYYFLTENYMIIIKKDKVNCFKYDEIKSISKKTSFKISMHMIDLSEYLYIYLSNKTVYKVLIYSNFLVNEKYRDITEYLLEKNKNIIVK